MQLNKKTNKRTREINKTQKNKFQKIKLNKFG